MGVHTVEVSSAGSGVVGQPTTTTTTQQQQQQVQTRPVMSTSVPIGSHVTTMTIATADNPSVEKGGGDQWGKNMQRWRFDNIDIAKGS